MRALQISLLVFILSISISAQWTYQNSNTQTHLTTVFFIDEQIGWITSNDGNILKTSNGGQNWISYPVVPSDTLVDLYFFTADSGIAIGDNKIYKSYTGGTSWNEVAVYPEFDLINIYFYDNYLGFIACEPRRILKTTDSGNSWNEIIVDSTFSFNSLFFKNETIGWASVSEGTIAGGSIFKTTDAGETWEKIHSNSHRLYAIKGFPESDTLFCIGIYVLHGAYRTLYSSQDSGETWTPVPLDIQTMLFHFSSPKVGRVCGYLWSSVSTNKILYTENSCNSWTTEDSTYGDFYTDWFFINDDLGWLVGYDGVIKHLNNTIYFPLEIGNKWYYQASPFNYPNHYNIIKTISDTTADGTRIVEIQKIYSDSISYDSEGWKFYDGKFFVSPSVGSPRGPIFDERIKHDTVLSQAPDEIEYHILNINLFGNDNLGQQYIRNSVYHTGGFGYTYHTANNIGITYQLEWEYPPSKRDTFNLIGVQLNGILLGDSTFSDYPDPDTGIPEKFLLSQNYPNPFNPSTKIKYSIPKVGTRDRVSVQLKVFDILGNEIAILVNEEKPVGEYDVEFNGSNLPSGIYFYQLRAGEYTETKKMVLIR